MLQSHPNEMTKYCILLDYYRFSSHIQAFYAKKFICFTKCNVIFFPFQSNIFPNETHNYLCFNESAPDRYVEEKKAR